MKCSAFIATSADGYIATPEGGVDWLHNSGNQDADMSESPDMGFNDFISSVDCMIMGRKCMETLGGFNLSPEQWPYGNRKVYALSHSVKVAPENLRDKVEMYSGDILALVNRLDREGYKSAYIDGGATITSFLNLQLINEIIITKAPVILGGGIPLFGETSHPIKLKGASTRAFPNDYIQVKYTVNYG